MSSTNHRAAVRERDPSKEAAEESENQECLHIFGETRPEIQEAEADRTKDEERLASISFGHGSEYELLNAISNGSSSIDAIQSDLIRSNTRSDQINQKDLQVQRRIRRGR